MHLLLDKEINFWWRIKPNQFQDRYNCGSHRCIGILRLHVSIQFGVLLGVCVK